MRIPFRAAATNAGVSLLITRALKSVSARFTILFSLRADFPLTFPSTCTFSRPLTPLTSRMKLFKTELAEGYSNLLKLVNSVHSSSLKDRRNFFRYKTGTEIKWGTSCLRG